MTKDEIFTIRLKLGLTQAKLAEKLGVTVVAISRWENGHCKPHNSTIKQLIKLSKEGPL